MPQRPNHPESILVNLGTPGSPSPELVALLRQARSQERTVPSALRTRWQELARQAAASLPKPRECDTARKTPSGAGAVANVC